MTMKTEAQKQEFINVLKQSGSTIFFYFKLGKKFKLF